MLQAGQLFAAPETPPGFLYTPNFVTETEEQTLIEAIRRLEFGEVRMHGVVARRRVVHFGWLYGYESWRLEPGPAIPDFLLALRRRAGRLAGIPGEDLEQVLVTEYPPGSVIGWHRDAPMFGPVVIGVSLAGSCRMRFQKGKAERRETRSITLEPRSAYVLSGPARSEWQHSIPPPKALRYSITFRTVLKR